MYTLRRYLDTMLDPDRPLRLDGTVTVCLDANLRPLCSAGNNAVIFRILHNGRPKALRCYLRSQPHTAEIYGECFRPKALYLYNADTASGEWVDVVVTDWIEGVTLRRRIEEAVCANDRQTLAALARSFDLLALSLVTDDRAHGDLKPENIIVRPDNSLVPIDFDAAYLPAFRGRRSPELGTAAYQHPARTADDFDAALDDYPAALISTALHALSLDPSLGHGLSSQDGLLFDPRHIAGDDTLALVLNLFDERGLAAQFRIAELLSGPTLRLPALPELLRYALRENAGYPPTGCGRLELDARGRLWGFRSPQGEWVIPPLYNAGFDFSEGSAAVRLRHTWSYIAPDGHTLLRCPQYTAVKPFRAGRATAERDSRRVEIDSQGKEFAI